MTNQEIYTKVRNHLLAQGRKAQTADLKDCLYLAPDGSKCAIGCLIPDELYKSEIEGATASSAFRGDKPRDVALVNVFQAIGLTEKHTPLLTRLQSVHDDWPVAGWKEALEEVAADYGFEIEA